MNKPNNIIIGSVRKPTSFDDFKLEESKDDLGTNVP